MMKRQSDLSLALFAMFASGGIFALLVATVLPPDQPIEWYLSAVVSGLALVIACAVLVMGRRISRAYAAWLSSVYLILLLGMVLRASNLSRATVAGMLIVVVIVLFAWFMPVWYSRAVGYAALGLIGLILLLRFPTNDGILTVIALVSLSILLTEVFGRFRRNLQRSSLIDHLSGAWNRAGFELLLETEIRNLKRTGEPLSLIYLDLDGFKAVNDALGHRGGDEVLQAISSELIAGVRARDSVARVGGDEFVLVLPSTNAEEARALVERLRIEVTACAWSHGIAEYRGGETMHEFIERSDAEMMQMKRGRGSRR